jgi:hypothetical protein
MLIREYTPADLDALRRMHASQGFDYPFPDLADPIFISKLVVEDDDGRPVMASLARLTCEMYLLVDRRITFRHSERSAAAADSVFAGSVNTPTREVEESLFGRVANEEFTTKTDPSTPSRAPASAGEKQTARDSAQDDGKSNRGAGKPRERWAQLLALHRAGERDLFARGLDDAHAWLPPRIAKRFGRRLESLGWLRDDAWTPYCKRFRK